VARLGMTPVHCLTSPSAVATIAVALLAAGIAFIDTTVALVILGIYATLTIVLGRLYQ